MVQIQGEAPGAGASGLQGRGWGRALGCGHSLALFVQQIEEPGGLLADEMDAADVISVVNVVPRDPFALVLFLQDLGV